MASLRLTGQRSLPRFRSTAHSLPRRYASSPAFNSSSSDSIRTGLYASALVVSTGLFVVYYLDSRSAIHRYFFTPLLRYAFDAETGHKLAVKVLRSGLGPRDVVADDDRLKFQLWGKEISNPVGLAAGFDKDGEAIDGLLGLGFSWVEIGSVTPKPQPGNPRPRVFHLPEDSALINRYGFPSQGHASVLSRLRARIPAFSAPETETSASLKSGAVLAVNLGKNKDSPVDSVDDFVAGVRTFGPYSDALVVNVSSPNTPGLRGLQDRQSLEQLLSRVTTARDEVTPANIRPRILLKIAPDLDELQLTEMAEVIRNSDIDGVIVSNTTIRRPSHLHSASALETGGLSGAPLKPLTLAALKTLRANLPATIPIIGCGGISTGSDALEYAKAGASLVQVYTGFGYDGVGSCRRIKDQLVEELAKEGQTWEQVVQQAVQTLSYKAPPPSATFNISQPKSASVGQLVAEAEELKRLLDQLGEKFGAQAKSEELIGQVEVPVSI